MEEVAKAMQNSMDHLQSKFTNVLEKLAQLRASGDINKQGARGIEEVEKTLREQSAVAFSHLQQIPGTMAQALNELKARGDRLTQTAAELKEKGTQGAAVHKEKLQQIIAAQQALAAKVAATTQAIDLSLSPQLGEGLRRHYGLPSAKVPTPFDDLPTFESWIGETPTPGSVVYHARPQAAPASPPPAVSKASPPPDVGAVKGSPEGDNPRGFESWLGGSASLAREMLEDASALVPRAAAKPPVGLNTWLEQSNEKPDLPPSVLPKSDSPEVPAPPKPPSPQDQLTEDSRGRFEEWLRRHKFNTESE